MSAPRLRWNLVGALAALLLARDAAAQAVTPNPERTGAGLALPGSSAASFDGASAGFTNPAGLRFVEGAELLLLHQRSNLGDRTQDGASLAVGMGPLALGASAEWVRPGSTASYLRSTLSLSAGTEAFSLGASWHRLSSDRSAALDALSGFDLGLVSRPFRALSLGVTLRDVNAPLAGGRRLPRQLDVGLALRPIGERVTLSGDYVVDDDAGFAGAAVQGGLKLRVVDGLNVVGGWTQYVNRGEFVATLGVGIDTAHFGLSYATSIDRGANGLDHTFGLRLSSARHPTLGLGSASYARLDVSALLAGNGGTLGALLDADSGGPLRLLELLRRAREDVELDGIVLEISDGELGPALVEELRAQVLALRASGKKVVAYISGAEDAEYWLATACDRIYVAPQATLMVNGLSSQLLFFGDALSRIGVKVDVARVGAFKNAPDQWTRSIASEEQRLASNAMLDTIYERYIGSVAHDRNIEPAAFKAAMEMGLIPPAEALDRKLIDGIAYPDEIDALVTRLQGASARTFSGYAGWTKQPQIWSKSPAIALVTVEGTIVDGAGTSSPLGGTSAAGSDAIVHAIEEARDDDDVKAIVVRVDSPGGSGAASDLIYRALTLAREKKPVVISMGSAAASGGYYVAIGGQSIWAEPTTVTGSIGVFGLKPDVSGLMEKLGVTEETLKRGERSDLFSFTRSWSASDQAAMQHHVDSFYSGFIGLVAAERKMKREDVDAIARGRIWSGADAKARGLVDQLGGLDEAIADARHRAGLEPGDRARLVRFGGRGASLASTVTSMSVERVVGEAVEQRLQSRLAPLGLGALGAGTTQALTLTSIRGPVAALPFQLRIR